MTDPPIRQLAPANSMTFYGDFGPTSAAGKGALIPENHVAALGVYRGIRRPAQAALANTFGASLEISQSKVGPIGRVGGTLAVF